MQISPGGQERQPAAQEYIKLRYRPDAKRCTEVWTSVYRTIQRHDSKLIEPLLSTRRVHRPTTTPTTQMRAQISIVIPKGCLAPNVKLRIHTSVDNSKAGGVKAAKEGKERCLTRCSLSDSTQRLQLRAEA